MWVCFTKFSSSFFVGGDFVLWVRRKGEEEGEVFTGRGPGGRKEKAGFRMFWKVRAPLSPQWDWGSVVVSGLWQEPGGAGVKGCLPTHPGGQKHSPGRAAPAPQ